MSEALVVAGEPSGDRIAARVASALAEEGVRCAGVGGPACRAAGVTTFVDTASLSAMGLADVAAKAPALVAALARVAGYVRSRRPRAALLVNFTELNQRLGRALRARGTKVLWCVAPQVWAWRPGRITALRDAADRMAVILPFEERLWRDAGYDAVYVGHPATEVAAPGGERGGQLAILPGSRVGEVRRLAGPFVAAAGALLASGELDAARMVVAPGLPGEHRAWLEGLAAGIGASVVEAPAEEGAGACLSGCDVSLCASGTASLEAALAGAAPVVAYRLDRLAYALARRLVKTPHVALPNVLLGARAFPELLQDEVTPERLSVEVRGWLARREEALRLAGELRRILAPPSPAPFGRRVAERMLDWLD